MADVKMPQLGESVTEGTIGKWLKSVGDKIEKYEPLCEVITDKVNAEIPSDFEGVLQEILVGEGETVPVGTLICRIVEAGTSVASEAVVELVSTKAPNGESVEVAHSSNESAARFSPAVLRLLQEHNIDPARVQGTGAGGRITRKDVLSFVESGRHEVQAAQVADTASVAVATTGTAAPTAPATTSGSVTAEGDRTIDVTPIRRTIAKRMVESKHQAPHAWMMTEIDMTELVRYRETVKDEFKRREGISLTYLPFFIKAVVETLKDFPVMNAVWTDEKIILKKSINISIAVAAGDALFVPVIANADRLSVAGLAHSISELAQKARSGKLSPQDISGGTFTVNNTGAFGSIQSQPIINTPQAAIVTMESIVRRPVVLPGDAIAIRSMMNSCVSLDHRILDGLVVGQFMQALKARLETMGLEKMSLY